MELLTGVLAVFSAISLVGSFVALINNYYFPAIGLFMAALISFILSLKTERRTPYGESQFALWQAFRRFLKDFSNLDRATLPQLVLWEHFLVYAVVLGVAREVLQQLPAVYPEVLDSNSGFARNWYWPHYMHQGEQASGMDASARAVSSAAGFAAMVSVLV